MSDRLFERAVLDWLEDGSDRTPRPAIDAVLLAVRTTPQERELAIPRRFIHMSSWMRMAGAAVAVAAVAVALAGIVAFSALSPEEPARPLDSPGASAPRPTVSSPPSPTRTASSSLVDGWPGPRRNRAGVYSLYGYDCASAYCHVGWMHNGYGSGDVLIRMAVSPVPYRRSADFPGTAVTVGGHAATYRRHVKEEQTTEEWLVDIDEMFIMVTVTSQPGTSQADLDEAYAIVASLRNEPGEAGAFRLAFTLMTDDWDSG